MVCVHRQQQVSLQRYQMRLCHCLLVNSPENATLDNIVYLIGYVQVHSEILALAKSLTVWSLTSTMPEFCNVFKITKLQFSSST